ncbi:MAG: bifunctional hydroxymethylpyrimidine kinase/phosphomethylpyrimidine kinase, partial [Verrucomicrobia bacterium]|nr:bifunctional hydroxymethylpyrimidine kinase/phosphomethylpyrimidine kinase [Verrucomicrobiota bacterium]
MQSPPIALTIAGSDSSAGAGLQADLKTFAAHGVHGLSAVTAIVAEVPGAVSRIEAMDPEMLFAQIHGVISAFPVSAIKTGMLSNEPLVGVVA